MNSYSVVLQGRKATIKYMLGMMSVLCVVFIFPEPVSSVTVLQTAVIRASDGHVYQVRYAKDWSVENFSVRNFEGAIPPHDIAAELYIAVKLLTSLPFTVFDYKTEIDTIAKDTLEKQKWRQVATVVGSKSFDLLIFAATRGKLPTFDFDEIAQTLAGASLETIVLIKAHMVATVFAKEASIHEQVFSDLSLLIDAESKIGINTIRNSFKALLKGGEYALKANEVVGEYLRVPELKERLGSFFRNIVPIARDLEFIFSITLNAVDLESLEKILDATHAQIEHNASVTVDDLFDEASIAAAIAELKHGGFFQNEAPQTVGSIDIRPLTLNTSAATVDVSPYFSDPDNDKLTYSAQSNNPSVVWVSASGSEITITPNGKGSARITVTGTDPGGLTAAQTIDVTVQGEHRCEYTLSQSSVDVPAVGGSVQIDVTTSSRCDWSAITSSDFLRASPSDGTGRDSVTITASANTGAERTGTVIIGGNTVTVEQRGHGSSVRATRSVKVCDRTPQVRDEIMDEVDVDDVEDCFDVSIPDLDTITQFSLSGRGITRLQEDDFYGFDNLQTLSLGENALTNLPEDIFKGLDNLEYVGLNGNQLTNLPEDIFKGLDNLEDVRLDGNQLTNLPEDIFKGLDNLEDVRLDGNQLTNLPEDIFKGLDNLEDVRLDDNQLTTLPPGTFRGLSSLKDLSLEDNQLIALPAGIFDNLSSLKSLHLENNQLTTLPIGIFRDLSNLTELELNNNPLTTLPTGVFDGLDSLSSLCLCKTQLTTLPEGVFDGLRVNQLVLAESSIKTLPIGTFRDLTRLQHLTLEKTQLTTLPAEIFRDLSSLTELEIRNNPLTTLPTGVFEGLENLTNLDLYNNQLNTLPTDVFKGLDNVTSLLLYGNQLTTLPAEIFNELNKLTMLFLFENQLTKLPPRIFKGLSNLSYLNLTDNPGAPFTLTLKLARTDNMDVSAPDAATIAVNLVEGAPFDMTVNLLVEGGTPSATMAKIAKGTTQSAPIIVTRTSNGSATVSLATVPTVPSSYSGIRMAVGNSIVLFGTSPNQAPETTVSNLTLTLTVGDSTTHFDLASNFRDPDNDKLAYSATSDNTGVATVRMSGAVVTITPKSAGSATVTAIASDGSLTATQHIEVVVEEAPRVTQTLVIISGDNQQGAPGEALLSPFISEVRDVENRGLAGIDITFVITAGGGSLTETIVTTNASGQAATMLTLGPTPGTNTVEGSVTGISAPVRFTATAKATKKETVNIPDPNLRVAIEAALGKASDDSITLAEMATLTWLNAPNADITDLTGLEHATNLTSLDLDNNLIADITPMAKLKKLRWLRLEDNSVSDISPLAGLTNLTDLTLWRNSISDIAPLAGLTKLARLEFQGTSVSDISLLAGLSNLTWLGISGSQVSDISSLANLTNLTKLYLEATMVSDISPLANLTNLTELDLEATAVSDISALAGLTNLTTLYFSNNSVSDISALANLTNLTRLQIGANSVSDISALAGLTNLTWLHIGFSLISDLSPLVTNKGLGNGDRVYVSGNPLSYLSINSHIPTLENRGLTVTFDPRTPKTLSKVSGDTQQGAPGVLLANPFVVKVTDQHNEAFEGVLVTFTVTAGGGLLITQNAMTDANGQVSTMLILGPNPGTNTVEASAIEISASVSFAATAQILPIPEDVNNDGDVNILDLVTVALDFGNEGTLLATDVNGDGVVNIQDLVRVANAIESAAAPASDPRALAMLTTVDVGQWLAQTQELDLTDAASQRGILFLKQLLAALTPKETALLANYPNPFNPETWIPYHLANDADVTLTIYDARGALVRRLELGAQPAGFYTEKSRAAYWDGRNQSGELVSSGLYYYQLRAGDFSHVRRMVIIK